MFKFLKYISVCLIICGCACTGNAGKENTLNKGGAEPNPKPVPVSYTHLRAHET